MVATLLLDDVVVDDDDEEEEEEGGASPPLLLDTEDVEKEEGDDVETEQLLLFFAIVVRLVGFAIPANADRFLFSLSPAADASLSFEGALLLSMVVAIGCIGSNNIC